MCNNCENAINCVNGRWCKTYKSYVEYQQPGECDRYIEQRTHNEKSAIK